MDYKTFSLSYCDRVIYFSEKFNLNELRTTIQRKQFPYRKKKTTLNPSA